jgi:hypothetical protein
MDRQPKVNVFCVTFTLFHLGGREIQLDVRFTKNDDLAGFSEYIHVFSDFFRTYVCIHLVSSLDVIVSTV